MQRFFVYTAACLLALSPLANAADVPAFEDYAVPLADGLPAISLDAASLQAAGMDKAQHEALANALDDLPKVAGHYVLAEWGCGTDCLQAALIDRHTGTAIPLPGPLCCQEGEGEMITTRPDSALIIVSGKHPRSNTSQTQYYVVANGRLERLGEH